jgi:hypothetical protein
MENNSGMTTVPLDDVLERSSTLNTLSNIDTVQHNEPHTTFANNRQQAPTRDSSPSNATMGPRHKLVTFAPDDPGDPKNWSKAYKWYCTMVVALTCFVVAFASSVISADIEGVMEEFNVSEEAALVSISLFVVGFGVGPMVFAPLSEVYGRRII